jgi:hypothetical protein
MKNIVFSKELCLKILEGIMKRPDRFNQNLCMCINLLTKAKTGMVLKIGMWFIRKLVC